MNVLCRPIEKREIPLLTDFLYEAIFQKPDAPPAPRWIIQRLSVWIYVDGFGSRRDDHGLVAEADGVIVGAVWARCIGAFGYLDRDTPELAISVYPQYRNRGIGTLLLGRMLDLLRDKGYSQASLSVQKENYALRMYCKAGFEVVRETAEEYIMRCPLV